MQFIKNGPDVPDRLLQAHEDDKVVFFCGAGISYPAKLPGFKGLVEKIYCKLGEDPDPREKAALERQQYDTVIGLLEKRIVGRRDTVRGHLPSVLTPDLSVPGATATHEALLTLAKNREGSLRIVTTNFDRLFHEVIKKERLSVSTFEAPYLPVPKNRWDGLVFLHGLLPDDQGQGDLDQLVLSSGDFGLAYLLEAWAARFVGELFRNFTVCFVGYSINDPVLRYMTDALAADKLRGESQTEMFAFGSFSKGKESEQENEWKAKNVTPILYREYRRHFYFHRTLHAWRDMYRDGVQGKEQIVAGLAVTKPVSSTSQDDVVGRMLWALSTTTAFRVVAVRLERQIDESGDYGDIDELVAFWCGARVTKRDGKRASEMARARRFRADVLLQARLTRPERVQAPLFLVASATQPGEPNMCHHGERNMSIPTGPIAHFIVVQAGFAFGLFETLLNGVASRGDLSQGQQLSFRRCIGEKVGALVRLGQRASHQEPDIPSRHLVLILHDPLASPVVDASSLFACGYVQTLPVAVRPGSDQRRDSYRSYTAIKHSFFARFATSSLPSRDSYLWPLPPHAAMDAHRQHIPTTTICHGISQGRRFAVDLRLPSPSASAHPAATHGATSPPPVQAWWQN